MKRTWDRVHAERQWGIWPGEHVVRFVMRRYGDLPREERAKVHFLDLGCGAGANTWFLAQEGFRVAGVDSSPNAIDRCVGWFSEMIRHGGAFNVTFQCASATKLPFGLDSFDCVIDSCCLQHFFFPREHELALSEAHRVLRPGGRIFSKTASQRHDERAFGGMEASRMSLMGVKSAFSAFQQVQIHHAEFTDPRHGTVAHYLVEGVKSPR